MNQHHSGLAESTVERLAVDAFAALGFAKLRGVEIDDAGDRTRPDSSLLPTKLANAIRKLNPALPADTVEQVVRTMQRPPHPTLIENNRWFHALLTDGVEVEYRDAATG